MTQEEADEAAAKQLVCDTMATLGVAVREIPIRPHEKQPETPDFEFQCDDGFYLVEMKRRQAEWYLTDEEKARLASGEIVQKQEDIRAHKTMADRIEKAASQFRSFQSERHLFRLVWYFTYGARSSLATTRVIATLVGNVPVCELGSGRQWPAYFFDDNCFQKFASVLDGALVVQVNGLATPNDASSTSSLSLTVYFLLNPFSDRYKRLRTCSLARLLPGGIDPLALEANGEALVVDSAADRASERATLNYLGMKYRINVPQLLRKGHVAALTSA